MDDDSILSDLSSELSSIGSLSPSLPPLGYPSPVSSQGQDSITVDQCAAKRPRVEDEPPATKKRRKTEPKPRTTEHLDLSPSQRGSGTDQKAQLDLLMKVLRNRRKIVVVAGAGISVSAGIPDFRSSTGLFTSLRSEHKLKASGKHLFDASVYQTNSATSSFHDMVRSLSQLVRVAKPTAFHQMLATLASEGRLMRLYTQNVDGIDVALPELQTSVPLAPKGPWPRTVQLHGGLEKMVCSKCNNLSNFEAALFDGPEPPPCTACIETDKVRTDHAGKRSHGIGRLRPRIVLYNEHNPDDDAIGAVVGSDLRARPDAVIVVGTSMKIPGVRRIVREMCGVVRGRKNGLAVWVNRDAPPTGKEFEDCWDLVVKGPSDEVAKFWTSANEESSNCTESEVERAKERSGKVKIMVESPQKERLNKGLLTPGDSPLSKPLAMPKINLKVKAPTALHDAMIHATPASKGASIPKILQTGSKPPGKQPRPRKPYTKQSKKPGDQKINTTFKASKAAHTAMAGVKSKPKPKPKPKPRISSEDELTLAPISPQAARNNGPVQAQITLKRLFPNLLDPNTTNEDDMDRLKRMSRETVSPTGSLPKDLASILN